MAVDDPAAVVSERRGIVPGSSGTPDPDELERAGAIIGTIRINVINVFDPSIPVEDRLMFRLVNRLHIKTREETVRLQLLFAEGEPFVRLRLEETERNLRALPFIQEAGVVAESVEDGLVAVVVTTRDDWSTGASLGFSSSGGKSKTGVSLSEGNLLGRGKQLEFDLRNGVDRTTEDLKYVDRNLFGTRLQLSASHRQATDGKGNALRFELPFYSLESRHSWGIDLSENTDRTSYYQEGDVAQRFEHDLTDLTGWVGFSRGLENGVTDRWITGFEFHDERFRPDTPLVPGYPSDGIPAMRKASGPTVEYQRVRADFIKVKYFERFSRFEDFNLGSSIDLRVQLSSRALGGANGEVLYDFSGSRGFRIGPHGYVLASALIDGRAGAREEGFLHFDTSHYYTGWRTQTLVTKLSGDFGVHLDASGRFLLGGDNGLRGFGTRRFDGDRRFVLNLEDRIHSNRLVLRLLQFGIAGFVDIGNAWGGSRATEVCGRERYAPRRAARGIDPGFNTGSDCRFEVENNSFGNLKVDAGISLLADIVRAAQTHFVRVNIAYPLNGRRYDQTTILFSVGKEGGF